MSDVAIDDIKDWTTGANAIAYQSCSTCRAVWYFRRGFCPSCGAADPRSLRASGRGTVYAASLVCRAATPEAKAHVPYMVVLVDAAEGFRLMAHGDKDLKIGDAVTARFENFTRRPMPYFVRLK
ncbi:Zn-ribbon domain-containing OB-fold protein [Bradyrhizobium prioriisuperbiae]|uniref:Zn-ribbon domain-containing OB-fold protein n=1 Tax=Bradyrhizobium prioriisuperbiae TaxID=2854389 RepID=UPI0028E6651A|nr:OB-fold domain-containing protein [Bradyrhizobium prioritasuperba]